MSNDIVKEILGDDPSNFWTSGLTSKQIAKELEVMGDIEKTSKENAKKLIDKINIQIENKRKRKLMTRTLCFFLFLVVPLAVMIVINRSPEDKINTQLAKTIGIIYGIIFILAIAGIYGLRKGIFKKPVALTKTEQENPKKWGRDEWNDPVLEDDNDY